MNVDDLPVAVLRLGPDRRIVAANPAALQLLGQDSLVGEHLGVLKPRAADGEDIDAVDWSKPARSNEVNTFSEYEMVIHRQDGNQVELLVDGGYDRDSSGTLTGATLLMRPKYSGSRQPGAGVAIVSAVSHELRSPLTSIRGYTALLLKQWDDVADEDRKSMLGQVDKDARRVTRLINELLDISRIQSGRVQLNRMEVDLAELTANVVNTVTMSYPDLEAEINFEQGFPSVWADPDKTTQVLTNLTENACKYGSAKGLTIHGTFTADEVAIEVIDQGPGIPADDLPRLFAQFFHSKTGRPTGTGLGLWISRGLIEAHGGTLTAESDGIAGAIFKFTLPLGAFEDVHGE